MGCSLSEGFSFDNNCQENPQDSFWITIDQNKKVFKDSKLYGRIIDLNKTQMTIKRITRNRYLFGEKEVWQLPD